MSLYLLAAEHSPQGLCSKYCHPWRNWRWEGIRHKLDRQSKTCAYLQRRAQMHFPAQTVPHKAGQDVVHPMGVLEHGRYGTGRRA